MATPAPSKPRRWPGRLLYFILFLVLEAAAFLTLGSLLAGPIEAGWARWLGGFGASLGAPLLIAALVAGRVREERVLGTLKWTLLALLLLGAGVPWLVATDATRRAVANRGLWSVEAIAGPRSAETRRRWQSFFLGGAPAGPADASPSSAPPSSSAPSPSPPPK